MTTVLGHRDTVCEMRKTRRQRRPQFVDRAFRNYAPQTESQKVAHAQLQKWVASKSVRDQTPFVVLWGGVGLGKSHLLNATWHRFTAGDTIPLWLNEVEFARRWQASHEAYRRGSDYEGPRPDEIIDSALDCPILLLDDLGKVKPTDAWLGVIYTLINHRWEGKLPTVVTTNVSPGELPGRIGEPAADRLLDVNTSLVLELTGSSYRGLAA